MSKEETNNQEQKCMGLALLLIGGLCTLIVVMSLAAYTKTPLGVLFCLISYVVTTMALNLFKLLTILSDNNYFRSTEEEKEGE